MTAHQASHIRGLGDLIRQASGQNAAPVEQWDPPYCGDIGLEIDVRGAWFYQGSEITRPELVKLFSRVLRCETNGRHYLVTPVEKVDVAVGDAPFLAVEMEVEGLGAAEQKLVFRTNVDDVVVAGADHPLLFREEPGSGGMKPYLRVRGRLYARLTRALYFELADLATSHAEDSEAYDTFFVQSAGAQFAMTPSPDDAFYNFDVG